MKAILTNETEFSTYVDEENKNRCMEALVEQYSAGLCDEYTVDAGPGYSQDRVFVFEFIFAQHDEIIFEFTGTTK
jgi:hypothetical protein